MFDVFPIKIPEIFCTLALMKKVHDMFKASWIIFWPVAAWSFSNMAHKTNHWEAFSPLGDACLVFGPPFQRPPRRCGSRVGHTSLWPARACLSPGPAHPAAAGLAVCAAGAALCCPCPGGSRPAHRVTSPPAPAKNHRQASQPGPSFRFSIFSPEWKLKDVLNFFYHFIENI